jgi:CxxC-x17-CxxC domain-containing protein
VTQQLQCRTCGATFSFTETEQEFYTTKNLSTPTRCKECRNDAKNQRGDRTMHEAVCAKCGMKCLVPFEPQPVEAGGQPILCKSCSVAESPV